MESARLTFVEQLADVHLDVAFRAARDLLARDINDLGELAARTFNLDRLVFSTSHEKPLSVFAESKNVFDTIGALIP